MAKEMSVLSVSQLSLENNAEPHKKGWATPSACLLGKRPILHYPVPAVALRLRD